MITLTQTRLFSEDQLKVLARRGIKDLRDLLLNIPRKYIDRTEKLDLRNSRAGDLVTVVGKIVHADARYAGRKKLTLKLDANGFIIYLSFFNAINYLQKAMPIGTEVACWGKLEVFKGRLSLLHPEWEIMSADSGVHTGRIVPIYKITEAMLKCHLSVKVFRTIIRKALDQYAQSLIDPIPEKFLHEKNLPGIREAFELIHFPESSADVQRAQDRLAFDELLVFSVFSTEKKKAREKIEKPFQLKITPSIQQALLDVQNALPFTLTNDQSQAISQLLKSATLPFPQSHLLMGDVGSGKTLVAFMLSLLYIRNQLQVAFIAPTEILARQHYQTFLNLLPNGSFEGIDLLLGKEKLSEKKIKLDRLERGETLIAIGTHSLIQEDVRFQNLALIIIDEQHRFGVEQRETLRAKGKLPDVLSMTATPIPRTLTLAWYSDLDPIYLREKPKSRIKIDTRIFPESDLPKIYKSIRKYVEQGRQVYIIYPVIEENENSTLVSIKTDYTQLETEIFPDLRLGLLHGKLSSDEKDRAMQKFQEGLIQVLVSTTVVEVGIDVANANVIVIRNAERFGLSQLHQLRGRVGRGMHQSFCILVASDNITEEGKERLSAMLRTDDGFELAKVDFEIRGSGEFFGTRQSGESEFRIADLRIHAHLFEMADDLAHHDARVYALISNEKNLKVALERGLVLFSN